jgi:formylglycine-generating enzyme required for sulfatase activity
MDIDGMVNIDPKDPTKAFDGTTGFNRVIRGGSWNESASGCRSAWRVFTGAGDHGAYMGFRLVCTAGLQ